jgi:hypothetical protein
VIILMVFQHRQLLAMCWAPIGKRRGPRHREDPLPSIVNSSCKNLPRWSLKTSAGKQPILMPSSSLLGGSANVPAGAEPNTRGQRTLFVTGRGPEAGRREPGKGRMIPHPGKVQDRCGGVCCGACLRSGHRLCQGRRPSHPRQCDESKEIAVPVHAKPPFVVAKSLGARTLA